MTNHQFPPQEHGQCTLPPFPPLLPAQPIHPLTQANPKPQHLRRQPPPHHRHRHRHLPHPTHLGPDQPDLPHGRRHAARLVLPPLPLRLRPHALPRGVRPLLPSWTALLREAHRCCTPGGWVESLEVSCAFRSEDGSVKEGTPMEQWGRLFGEAGGRLGRRFDVVGEGLVGEAFEAAGFVDVGRWEFKVGVFSLCDLGAQVVYVRPELTDTRKVPRGWLAGGCETQGDWAACLVSFGNGS